MKKREFNKRVAQTKFFNEWQSGKKKSSGVDPDSFSAFLGVADAKGNLHSAGIPPLPVTTVTAKRSKKRGK